MTLAPPRLADRLGALFTRDSEAAAAELEALVAETQALVTAHVDGVDLQLPVPVGARAPSRQE